MGGRKKKVLCDKSSMYFFHDTPCAEPNHETEISPENKIKKQSTAILVQ